MNEINDNDPRFRKWGFYYNPDDPRFFKRTKSYKFSLLGSFEFNYAHRISFLLTGLILIFISLLIYVEIHVRSHVH